MLELFKYEFTENEINELIKISPDLKEISEEEIKSKIDILLNIGCDANEIKNIIISNPFYLNRMDKDINNLINKLYSLNIKNLDILFDSNPFLLNKDVFEINEFISNKIKDGMNIFDIIDIIENDSYSLDE